MRNHPPNHYLQTPFLNYHSLSVRKHGVITLLHSQLQALPPRYLGWQTGPEQGQEPS